MATIAASKAKVKKLPTRDKVKKEDTWDLASLYASDADWEKDLKKLESQIPKIAKFKGTLAESPQSLAKYLKFDEEVEQLGEKLGNYAFLRTSEDTSSNQANGMYLRFMNVASRAGQEGAFARPEILSIPDSKMKKFLAEKVLAPYRLVLERLTRYKPHTLSPGEEKLLAMQAEMSDASNQIFGKLNDADLKFGNIELGGETIELSHGSFSRCLDSNDRAVRKKAFHQLYAEYADHAQTLAACLNASVQRDVYYARCRDYPSTLESALFPIKFPFPSTTT